MGLGPNYKAWQAWGAELTQGSRLQSPLDSHPEPHGNNQRPLRDGAQRPESLKSLDAPTNPALTKAQLPLLPKDGLLQVTAVSQQLLGSGCQAPPHHHLQT